jgi:hypothetical protein
LYSLLNSKVENAKYELPTIFWKTVFANQYITNWDFSDKKLRRRKFPQPVVTGYKVRIKLLIRGFNEGVF